MYKVSEKLDQIDNCRKAMKKSMKELIHNDPDLFVSAAVECHLR